jgi:APA family basic amino acid/polyamine antiporter
MQCMAVLKRRLDRIDALAVSLGGVIGVGVFLSTGLVLRGAGGFVGATVMWIVVGVICLTGAILYADLSARVPEAGGGYAYVRVAFGRPVALVYGWLTAGIALPVRQAATFGAVGLVLARWLPLGSQVIAAAVVVLLAALNLLGVRAGAVAQRLFTSGKLATLALVIFLAIPLALTGSAEASASISSVSFVTAVAACWYTYLGWQDVVVLAEEVHEPRRDLPVVLVGTVVFTMALYLTVHTAVYFALGGGSEASGETPAVVIASRTLGSFGAGLLSALIVSSMVGGAAQGMMVRPRIAMAVARDGLAPAAIAAVNRAGTPYGALLFHASVVFALVLTNPFKEILPLLVYSQGILGVFETASYFAVLRKRPELPTSRFHPWAPLTFIIANAALCVMAAWEDPLKAGLAIGLLALFSLVYAIARRRTVVSDLANSP